MSGPFAFKRASPGDGTIHLAFLPPDTPRLRTINYQYPLKLVSPAPLRAAENLVHTVYLLTYGGGLVAGDSVNLHVTIESATRLILLTQGSTKLFKSPNRDVISRQCMTVDLMPGAALCYLPDPVQPFERSCFEQKQVYNVNTSTSSDVEVGSLCVLDWVSNGRPSNGENWSFFRYGSKNEVYLVDGDSGRLLLRDNVLLDDGGQLGSVASRMAEMSVYGTLILYGPLFQDLGNFLMDEFKILPRIGGRKWDSGSESGDEDDDLEFANARRLVRQRQESIDGVLWSAAATRGCVVVKFGARHLEGGRRWLRTMLIEEGTVEREFGERCLLCLR